MNTCQVSDSQVKRTCEPQDLTHIHMWLPNIVRRSSEAKDTLSRPGMILSTPNIATLNAYDGVACVLRTMFLETKRNKYFIVNRNAIWPPQSNFLGQVLNCVSFWMLEVFLSSCDLSKRSPIVFVISNVNFYQVKTPIHYNDQTNIATFVG